MISKIWEGVRVGVGKVVGVGLEGIKTPVARLVAAVVGAGVFFTGVDLLAQGGDPPSNTVTFTPIVNFGDLFTTITAVVGPLVAGALGLGLAIWGARYVFSIIKSVGR